MEYKISAMQLANYVDLVVVNQKWILEKSLWALNIPLGALVIWRLYSLGLQTTYRSFFIYLALALTRTAILFPLDPKAGLYYQIWSATQPLLWASSIAVVSELYSLALRKYRGIYSLGRWFFFSAVAASVIISALTVLPTVATPKMHSTLYYFALIERGIYTSLGIFLLMLMALVAWFPVPLSRNLLTHCSVFTARFLINNVAFLYWHVGGRSNVYLSTLIILVVQLISSLCWAILLSRNGEVRTAALLLGRNSMEERRLLGQLESLNATLLRTARK